MTALEFAAERGIELPASARETAGQCRIRWNKRFRTTLGKAKTARRGDIVIERVIELNPILLQDADELRDTFLHELAHHMVGTGQGHNLVWQSVARSIGARPERGYGREVANKLGVESRRAPRKVIAWCEKCGNPIHGRRRFDRTRIWAHKRCGGRLTPC